MEVCAAALLCACASHQRHVSRKPRAVAVLLTCQHQMFLNSRLFAGRLCSQHKNILLH